MNFLGSKNEGRKRIISKWGGGLLKDPDCFVHAAMFFKKAFYEDEEEHLIVVSATYKTTDILTKLFHYCLENKWGDFEKEHCLFHQSHHQMVINLKKLIISDSIESKQKMTEKVDTLIKDVQQVFEQIYQRCRELYLERIDISNENLKLMILDDFLSFGEDLSSKIFATALDLVSIPTKNIMATDFMVTGSEFGQAKPNFPEISKKARDIFFSSAKDQEYKKTFYLTQGFLGLTKNNHKTTLGLEGSDYSASILASILPIDALKIWKEFPGVCTFDPQLLSQGDDKKKLSYFEKIHYDDINFLIKYGAKILFPQTLEPHFKTKRPLFIGQPFPNERSSEALKDTLVETETETENEIRNEKGTWVCHEETNKLNAVSFSFCEKKEELMVSFLLRKNNSLEVIKDLKEIVFQEGHELLTCEEDQPGHLKLRIISSEGYQDELKKNIVRNLRKKKII